MHSLSEYIYPKLTPDILQLAERVNTPSILYDLDHITQVVRNIKKDISLIQNSELFFSMKALNTKEVLLHLLSIQVGIDTASIHEYRLAKKLGFKDLSITSPGLKKSEICEVAENGDVIDFDSIEQINYFGQQYPGSDIGIRISNDCINGINKYIRFGVSIYDESLYEILDLYNLKIKKAHFHIGPESINELFKVWDFITTLNGYFDDLESINFGGGLLNLYNNRKETLLGFLELDNLIKNSKFSISKIIFEPGDALVINSGFLVTEILSIKKIKEGKRVIITDSSPWAYAPWTSPSVINISNVNNVNKCGGIEYYIAGNTLYDGDYYGISNDVGSAFIFNESSNGDRLLFSQFGAYTMSNFRGFHLYPQPKEYFFSKSKF